jgi:hypothetical protein
MARKNEYGRYILSAGEVGAFTVCPEAWRLKMIERASFSAPRSTVEGEILHQEWAAKHEEIHKLAQGFKLVFVLILTAVLMFMLKFHLS